MIIKSIRLFLILLLFNSLRLSGANQPNIVVFLTDDHSQLDSSPYGDRGMRTPNMQRLANAGLTFDQAFVASPSCAPSRAALLTGLMPARNGAEPNHARVRPELKKWPAYFQELGYEVVAYGKVSHYQHTVDFGFDSFAHDTFHDHAAIPAAVDFLKARTTTATTRPLCLMVGSNWPHVPWPDRDASVKPGRLPLPAGSLNTTETRQSRARFVTAVEKADADLGTIYDAARDQLGTNTLFLFSSDHGTQWPFGKWNCYDAGLRVPLIVDWPGQVKPATRTAAMVSWVDFLPTLLEAVGGKAPSDIDGQSFLPVIKGHKENARDRIFATHSADGKFNVYPIRSVRTLGWKYILNLHPEFAYTSHIDLPGELARERYWASWEEAAKTDTTAAQVVKRYHQRPAEELYDLTADPHEQNNLAADPAHEARRKQMRADLEAWMEQQGDQRKVYGTPRPLSDPTSYGYGAYEKARAASKKK